jgi:hypothetical protein
MPTVPWLESLCLSTDDLKLHPFARAAIDITPIGRPFDMEEIFIFTDGTGGSGDDPAAWSFVAIGIDPNAQLHFLGFLCATVMAAGPFATTLDVVANNAAEYTAVLWAALWMMQNTHCDRFTVFTDSQLSIGMALGDFSPKVNPNLAHLLADVWLAFCQHRACSGARRKPLE